MPNPSCQLILGSASPRRKELLKWTWLPFKVVVSDAEEICSSTDPKEYVVELAKLKARDVFRKCQNEKRQDEKNQNVCGFPIIIGSDTVVVSEGKVLEKPKSKEHAREMLKSLSGKRHDVFTAVAIVHPQGESAFFERTEVQFDAIEPDLLELYLSTGESMDKAGSYGIQGAALAFINSVNGSYSNVVGLPVNKTLQILKETVLGIWPELTDENWRSCFDDL